jgi:hypothetical protein
VPAPVGTCPAVTSAHHLKQRHCWYGRATCAYACFMPECYVCAARPVTGPAHRETAVLPKRHQADHMPCCPLRTARAADTMSPTL